MFVSIANAAGAQGGAAGGQDTFSFVIVLALMFAIFYFLLIRPQQKRAKQHRSMLDALQKGDHVITSGGILGRIVSVENEILVVDLGETKVRIPRGYVSGTYDPKALDKVANEAPSQDGK